MTDVAVTLRLVPVPDGVKRFSSELSDDGLYVVESFGIERMFGGAVSYNGSNYRPGYILRYQPTKLRAFVANPNLTPAEINLIGKLSLELFESYEIGVFTKDSLDLISELEGRTVATVSARYTLSETQRVHSHVSSALSAIGVLVKQLVTSREGIRDRGIQLMRELHGMGVIMVDRPFTLDFPIDLIIADWDRSQLAA